jgi:proline iminopeptidase
MLWRTDFADPKKAPDFRTSPLYRFPANLDVNRELVADMDARASGGRLLEQLRSLTIPVLVVHGQEDRRPPPLDVVEVLPNCEVAMIPGAAHLPWLERPELVADAFRGWIRQVLPRT